MQMFFGLLLLLLPSASTPVQPPQGGESVFCGWCCNHVWFDEHAHGCLGYLVENGSHGTDGYYPYSCTEEHDECGESSEELALFATMLDSAQGAKDAEILGVLRKADRRGIAAEPVSAGIRLIGTCAATGNRIALVVPLQRGSAAAVLIAAALSDE